MAVEVDRVVQDEKVLHKVAKVEWVVLEVVHIYSLAVVVQEHMEEGRSNPVVEEGMAVAVAVVGHKDLAVVQEAAVKGICEMPFS